jgi:myo-inositol-1(or 4)-monophosphatase
MARFEAPPVGVGSKSSETDLVSDADREAEEVIAALLAAERPDDGLLAEEGSVRESANGRRWIVDPLDGTINYLYRFPAWCVSVALEDRDGLAAGVVYDPLRDELFAAARGGGCSADGAPVRVRGRERLDMALVATGFAYAPERRSAQAELVSRVLPGVRDIRRAGAAALDLAWVAAGRLDGYYEHGGKPWDWAAGRVLVTEAGGALRDLDGDPTGLAAANPALLPQLVALLN